MTPDERKVLLQLTLDAFRDFGFQAQARPRVLNGTSMPDTYIIIVSKRIPKPKRSITLSITDDPPGIMMFHERTGVVSRALAADPDFKTRVIQAYADINLRYFGKALGEGCKDALTKCFVLFLQEMGSLKITDTVLLTRFIEGMADGTWSQNFVSSIKPRKRYGRQADHV